MLRLHVKQNRGREAETLVGGVRWGRRLVKRAGWFQCSAVVRRVAVNSARIRRSGRKLGSNECANNSSRFMQLCSRASIKLETEVGLVNEALEAAKGGQTQAGAEWCKCKCKSKSKWWSEQLKRRG
jgi:hypothetical protein